MTVVTGHAPSKHAHKASPRGAFFIALLFASLGSLWQVSRAAACAPDRIDEQAGVSAVVDGDTLRLANGRLVRFIGINTPELGRDGRPHEAYAIEARDALAALIGDARQVTLRYGQERQDRYGRLLAHVYLPDGRSLEAELLQAGLAAHIVVPPNVWHADCYRGVETGVRSAAAQKGVWTTLYRPIPVNELPRDSRGFRIIRGRIVRVGESQTALWLNFPRLPGELARAGVALRVSRKDLGYFAGQPLHALQGREVEARGWLYASGKQLVMQLRHPAALRVLSH